MGNNINVPYSGFINGGVREGDNVVISGRPNHKCDSFSVNLCSSPTVEAGDVALHFNPRFRIDSVVRNHKQGRWGAEERSGGNPFQRGTDFTMHLEVKSSGYKVLVNNSHFCDFTHRLAKEDIQFLHIRGDVIIHHITKNSTPPSFPNATHGAGSVPLAYPHASAPSYPPGHAGGGPGYSPGPAGGVPGYFPGSAGGVPGYSPGPAGGVPGYSPGPAGGVPGYSPGPAGGVPGYSTGPAGGVPGYSTGPAGGVPGYYPGPAGGVPGYSPGPAGGVPGYSPGPAGGVPGYSPRPAGGVPGFSHGPAPSFPGQVSAQTVNVKTLEEQTDKKIQSQGAVVVTYRAPTSTYSLQHDPSVLGYSSDKVPPKRRPTVAYCNPLVPLNLPINDGFHPGKIISVVGIPRPGATRFQVNLACGDQESSDLALHFDVRFSQKVVVLTHRKNGQYGNEEKTASYFPFILGESFEIMLLCEPHAIKVAVNGSYFIEFIHRIQPIESINHLQVQGDVTLSEIGIQEKSVKKLPFA